MTEEGLVKVEEAAKGKAHVRSRFITGVLVLIPLAVTVFVLQVIYSALTGAMGPFLKPWAKKLPLWAADILSLVVMLALIYLTGWVATRLMGRKFIQWGEALLLKVPLVKTVYSATKQVIETFTVSKKNFQAVVFVAFPHRGSMAVGFATGSIRNEKGEKFYLVFLPTTPNPTSGYLLMMPPEDVQFTDVGVDDGIKMIVSGGMLPPASYKVVDAHF